MRDLEIENFRLRMALKNAHQDWRVESQRSTQLESMNRDLHETLAWLRAAPVPNVTLHSTQDNPFPPISNHGIPAIPSVLGPGHDDTSMDHSYPATDSAYASTSPVAPVVSGDTNTYSYDHPTDADATTNASFNQFDEFQMTGGMQGNAADDITSAPHVANATGEGEMFPMDVDFVTPANAHLQQSSLSFSPYTQNSRPLARGPNPSAQQGGSLNGRPDITMYAQGGRQF
jgi:hypothetical protein